MNIFILHADAKENAKLYSDKHIVKMVLESVQILCSVSHLKGVDAPYKLTHENHPCVLVNMVTELNNEYKFRYNKVNNHKSYDVMVNLVKPKFDRKEATGKFFAVVDEVKLLGLVDIIKEYRKYYKSKYNEMKMTWKNRDIPSFMEV
ncbi:MAG: hypothetical protein ACRCXT_15045 [Paraclostridium sp.]